MTDADKAALKASLFKATSAFDTPRVNLKLAQEAEQFFGPSPSEQLGKIASLIEQGMDQILDVPEHDEALTKLEEALELARKHA